LRQLTQSLRCCISLFFLNFYLYINPLKEKPYQRLANAREFYYRIIVACKYAQFIQFDYHISFFVSLSLSLFCCKAISYSPSHSHALQQLIRFINSYHLFYRQNQLCQPIVKFRAHPAASFLLLIGNPSYSFACTKAKAKFIFTHSLFVFSFSFLFFYYSLVFFFITTAVNSRRSQCNARKRVGLTKCFRSWSRTLVFFRASPSFIKSRFSHDRVLVSIRPQAHIKRPGSRTYQYIVASTIMIDNFLERNADLISLNQRDTERFDVTQGRLDESHIRAIIVKYNHVKTLAFVRYQSGSARSSETWFIAVKISTVKVILMHLTIIASCHHNDT